MKNAIQLTLSDELLEALTEAVKQAVKQELPKYQGSFRKEWLSTEEVMELLDVSRRTLRNYRKDAILSYSQLAKGGKILYPRKQIEAFLRENMTEATRQAGTDDEETMRNPFLQNFPDEYL